MDVIISSRHFEIDEALRQYTEQKINKLAADYPKLTTARVVMSLERNWQIVEAHVNGKHLTLNAKSQSNEMSVSVDTVFDKLEKQLRRYLEKVQEHRGGKEIEPEEEIVISDELDDEN